MPVPDPGSWNVTSASAALLTLLLLALSIRVTQLRARVAAAQSGDSDAASSPSVPLLRARQAQAQFALHAPIGLLLVALIEARIGTPAVTWLATLLVVAQLCHALGASRVQQPAVLRVVGTILTWVMLLAATCAVGWQVVTSTLV